jgi:lipopolysaccharide assembly outer membrane protein LptD (OstA)
MKKTKYLFIPVLCAFVFLAGRALAEDIRGSNAEPVELNGDVIEYKAEEGKFVATGNVYLKQNNAVLFCDRLEFYRDKKEGHAEGNVVLDSDQGKIWADKAFYNFETKKGEFTNARIMADPIYGRARSIIKVRENYYVISDGYVTTSDYDDPEYRLKARTVDIYPGDKATARGAVMYFGTTPVMYFPKYSQDLSGKRPHISFVPGYERDFGGFLLTTYRTSLNDRVELAYHLDVRELKGFAWGVDAKYSAEPFGTGLVRTYYMNEHNTDASRAWEDNTAPVVERQRYRVEWRHLWQIDPATIFIGQYYKHTDSTFLQKYFPREYREDEAPPTYAIITHTMPKATMSLRVDKRVNRFESNVVERLPEASFALSNQEIGDTGFYFKSANTASSLVKKDASPSDDQNRTVRLDTDNEVSRPFKVSFLELRPYVGTQQTYYTRTLFPEDDDSVRGIFKTGVDVSTKFYKIYDVIYKKYGVEINRLRHVITPTIGYFYQHKPTLSSEKLFYYDSVDAHTTVDKFSLGLENKLQTKRDGASVDLARVALTTDFRMKDSRYIDTLDDIMTDKPSSGSFGDVTLDIELTPNRFVSFYSDMTYDNDQQHLRTANFDIYLNSHKNWAFDLSRRFTYDDDDIVTAALEYKFNPKWRAAVYERWNVDIGEWQERRYSFVRDLHSWEVEFSVGQKKTYDEVGGGKGGGNEVWIIFRIKAFPSVSTGGDTVFSRIAPGPQSNP